MGSSTNRALIAKSEKARKQSVAYAIEHSSLDNGPSKGEMRAEAEALCVSRWNAHFDISGPTYTVCAPGKARNAGELQRKKAGGLPMGQQFTNAARTDVRRGGILHDASRGWRK